MERLAAHKRLPVDWLRQEIGLRDLPKGIGVPYWSMDGDEIAVKRRLGLASNSYRWPLGRPIEAYGLWRLDTARRYGSLILVEGESDCWALWLHGFAALGLPGADSARCTLHRHHLQDVDTLFVHQEPGRGGSVFVLSVLSALRRARYQGDAWILTMPEGIKDLADLHAANTQGVAFSLALREQQWAAEPIPHDLWLGTAAVRALLLDVLRDPSPQLRQLLLEAVAPGLGELLARMKGGA